MAPTKNEIEAQNAELAAANDELTAQNAELTDQLAAAHAAAAGKTPAPRRPERPETGLSAGEFHDLQTAGVTVSPFNGEEINALDEGVEPGNPEAQARAEAAQKRKRERAAAAAV